MAEEEKESKGSNLEIENVAKKIYEANTVNEIKEAQYELKNIQCSEFIYNCLSDYATFRSVEIRKQK